MGQSSTRTVVLLVNTHSRSGEDSYEYAVDFLSGHTDIDLIASRAVQDPALLDEATDELLAYKPDVFLLGSGDGTISHVIDNLMDTGVVLGIIPLGTTNNYARTLGIPLALDDALATVVNGVEHSVDLAYVEHDYFVNVASIGLSTRIARSVSRPLKRYFGRAAYAIAGIKELLTHRAFVCNIEAEGKSYEFKTHQLVIANGSYHSGQRISDQAHVYNGKLVVFSMDDGRRWKLLVNFIRFNTGGLDQLKGNEVVVAKSLTLSTAPRRRVEIDGEVGPRTPVSLECMPRSIRVLLPDVRDQ